MLPTYITQYFALGSVLTLIFCFLITLHLGTVVDGNGIYIDDTYARETANNAKSSGETACPVMNRTGARCEKAGTAGELCIYGANLSLGFVGRKRDDSFSKETFGLQRKAS